MTTYYRSTTTLGNVYIYLENITVGSAFTDVQKFSECSTGNERLHFPGNMLYLLMNILS